MRTCCRLAGLLVIAAGVGAGAQSKPPAAPAPFRSFAPVTEAMLEHPDPADWIHWRRTPDNWGYSPLTQVTTQNVMQLQAVWSHKLDQVIVQPGPLVHAGIMYVPQPPGVVRALDAVTGTMIWEYRKTFETSPSYTWSPRTRTIAMYADNVYVATPDAHIVALNARTGEVVWDHTVADYRLGYRYTSGPIAVKGKIVAGMTGCERYKNDVCFISAHDARTGRELWRLSTIARPGEPGGDTWGTLPLNRRAGGDVWIPGSYDPRANLMYWSTAQAKPWARVARGTDGDALYTNSVLAIDPDTGKLAWYYQFLPGETLDHDEVFENVLVDRNGRTSLFKMGKLGILWEVDRKTGKFVAAHDLGFQNIVEVNPQTGTVFYRPDMIPKLNATLTFCPGMGGIKNWQSSAYYPETQTLYIPIRPNCETAEFTAVNPNNIGDFHFYGNPEYSGAKHLGVTAHPAMPNERGMLVAMDINSGRLLWRQARAAAASSAVLTTAGGLVVAGFADGTLVINDAKTGQTLFETRTPGAPVTGFPISYAVGGKQYIAYAVGGNEAAMKVLALP